VLSGKLFCFNALTNQTSPLKIKKSEETVSTVLEDKENFYKKEIDFSCEVDIISISIESVLTEENIQFIDVREKTEQPKIEGLPVTYIPLSQLKHSLNKIEKGKKKAFFCQSGIRSKNAVSILHELNINDCFSIIEGAYEIKDIIRNRHCDEETT
jgi:adenylyltransferase/sulfurtransferase